MVRVRNNAGLLLGQRRKRWTNIKPALNQRHMFAGNISKHPTLIQWCFHVIDTPLTKCRRRWLSIKTTLGKCCVLYHQGDSWWEDGHVVMAGWRRKGNYVLIVYPFLDSQQNTRRVFLMSALIKSLLLSFFSLSVLFYYCHTAGQHVVNIHIF